MEIIFEPGQNASLTELLSTFHDSGEVGRSDIVDITATPAETSFSGSGMAELVQLVVVLGSSGAIAALTTILLKYFDTHPTATLEVRITEGDRKEVLVARNVDAKSLNAFFERFILGR